MPIVNYSTEPKVRDEAGFTSNTDIFVVTVEQYQDEATGILESYISRKYNVAQIRNDPGFLGSSTDLLFQRIEELLGAGHLLNKEYGTDDLQDKTNGDKKINDAYKLMDDIVNGIIRLVDKYGNPYTSISTSDGGPVFAFPITSEGRFFTTDQVF